MRDERSYLFGISLDSCKGGDSVLTIASISYKPRGKSDEVIAE